MVILDSDGHRSSPRERDLRLPVHAVDVTIEDDVFLGYGCKILKGSIVGEGATVAAGAIVTGVVPSRAVVAGIPARVIGWN